MPATKPESSLNGWVRFLMRVVRAVGAYGKVHSSSSTTTTTTCTTTTTTTAEGGAGAWVVRCIEGATVPKRWFTAFYVVGACANAWVLLGPALRGSHHVGLCSWLFQVQVLRRLHECLFVSRTSPAARMHALHLVLGLTYYAAVPLTILHCGGGRGHFRSTEGECLVIIGRGKEGRKEGGS